MIGMGRNGLGWVGMGLGWVGMDWEGSEWDGQKSRTYHWLIHVNYLVYLRTGSAALAAAESIAWEVGLSDMMN